jgi:hypothetical protein
VGSWSFVPAKPSRRRTSPTSSRAIHGAEAPLAARLAQARETTMRNTRDAAPRPELIHPGVRKYQKEIGL